MMWQGVATPWNKSTIRIIVVDLLKCPGMVDDGTNVTLIVLNEIIPVAVDPVAVVVVNALQHAVAINVVAAVISHHQRGLGGDIQ